MLCERCQKEVAVVHITRMDADSGKAAKHDFCVKCAEEAEGRMFLPGVMKAGWTSYGGVTRAGAVDDAFDLNRFVRAQQGNYEEESYETALAELRGGRKRTHWMWYIFPQLDGLGLSSMAKRYAIRNLEEARAYLEDRVLGPRLVECMQAVLGVEGRSAHEIFGSPDDLKLRSCATLFACVAEKGSVFERVLEKYYGGEQDERTLALLKVG